MVKTGIELVSSVIRGEHSQRTPLYGWVRENMSEEICKSFGSVENFEDHYKFDLAHLFGGPNPFNTTHIQKRVEERKQSQANEFLPEELLEMPLYDPNNLSDYLDVKSGLEHYSADRKRFCYMQTPGFFECYNDVFGIENHLCYLALYPDEMKELYLRQQKWTKSFADNIIDLGMDMIHLSDDWGAQNSLMFSESMWEELILPYHASVVAHVKKRGAFASLHSDGYIAPILALFKEIGFDMIHPWQESSGMTYQLYLDNYADNFGIIGGLCIQTTLGFGDLEKVKNETERVFRLLKGKRWVFCTTHFVQDHCSIDELVYAFDLARNLAD